MHKRCLAAAMPFLLSACMSLAPTYKRPAAPIPATWPTSGAYQAQQPSEATAADIPWREVITDDKLQQVVEQALTGNRDLRKAVANIEAARSEYRVRRANLVPQLAAVATANRSRSLVTSASGETVAVTSETASTTVGLSSFEIDLFGKQRSLSTAAWESYLATEAAGRATRISLIAETVNAYLALAADKSRWGLARKTSESAQRSLDLMSKRLDAGVASRLDLKQAETIYQQARADVASLTATIAQDRNALELLVGERIGDELLPDELPGENDWLADVPAGVSSEVLLQRPDVLAAEHNLKAANANIGAARAAFFPSLTLTANGGRASSQLSNLFGGTNTWSIGPTLTLPIFSGGANAANLAYSKAQLDSYLSEYEATIQTAFKEVADTLAVRATIQEQLAAQAALVDAAAESYRIAAARYQKGADTYLNALDSQRTLYAAEKTLMATRLASLENIVTSYRALGGGLAQELPPR